MSQPFIFRGANGSCPCHCTARRSSPSTQWSLGMHVWLSQSAYATWHVSQWMRWGVKGVRLTVRWWSKHFMHSIYFLKISGETCLDNSCAKHSESRKSLQIEGHSVNCVPFWSCLLSCFPILGLGFPWRFSCKDFLGTPAVAAQARVRFQRRKGKRTQVPPCATTWWRKPSTWWLFRARSCSVAVSDRIDETWSWKNPNYKSQHKVATNATNPFSVLFCRPASSITVYGNMFYIQI